MSGRLKIKYLDNNHYIISGKLAAKWCIDGKLPRRGYEKKADIQLVKERLGGIVDGRVFDTRGLSEGWILRTPHLGKQVWAIQLVWRGI